MPILMLAAPLLRLLGVGETTMKWLAPAVTAGAAVLLLIGLWLGGVWGFHLIQRSNDDEVEAKIKLAWATEREGQLRELAKLQDVINRLNGTIAANTVEAERKRKDADALLADAQRQLADSLRNRRSRTADGVPDTGRPGGTAAGTEKCTGADLYQEDGNVLRRIGGDADAERNALMECRAKYNAVREAIINLQPGVHP